MEGIALQPGDRILVLGQPDRTANGIFLGASAEWVRASDFEAGLTLASDVVVPVIRPDGAHAMYHLRAGPSPLKVAVDPIAFQEVGAQRYVAPSEPGSATPPPWVLVTDFGAKGDGASDDTQAFQKALDSVGASGGTVHIPGTARGYSIRKTLVVRDKAGLRLLGAAAQGGRKGVGLIWDGEPNGTVLLLDRTRDSYFSDFSIIPGKSSIEVAIRIDNLTPPQERFNSTNNSFDRIAVGASRTGILIGDRATANNDLHTFRDVTIDGPGDAGYVITSGQSKWIRILGGTIATRQIGIFQRAGSFVSENVNYSHNDADHVLGAATDVITIRSAQSEGTKKFIDDLGASGASCATLVEGCRVSPMGVGGDNVLLRYRKRGPLTLTANDFAGGVHHATVRLQIWGTDPGASAMLTGNVFPNAEPIDTTPGKCVLLLRANNFVSPEGHRPLDISDTIRPRAELPLAGPQGRIWRIASPDRTSIHGIAGGWEGRELGLINSGTGAITLLHSSFRSAANHRIMCPAGADCVLHPDDCVRLIYDDLAHVWRFA